MIEIISLSIDINFYSYFLFKMALPILLNIGPGGGGSTSFHNFLCENFDQHQQFYLYNEKNFHNRHGLCWIAISSSFSKVL